MVNAPPRIALVNDWIVSFGGAERVLIVMHKLFPTAPIFTLFWDKDATPSDLEDALIIPSVLQRFPRAIANYQSLLPLYPYAVEQFDLSRFDVVISLSHASAKGVITSSSQKHLCYCYTPMRYIWDHYHTYLKNLRLSPLKSLVFRLSASYLRQWDYISAQRIDHFIAISETVKERLERIYRRKSIVIYPPVDTNFFVPLAEDQRANEYFLMVGRFVAYKAFEFVIEHFNYRDEPLLIVGDGPLRKRLMRLSKNPKIEFVGTLSDEELRVLYQNALALIFPTFEDFGLVPVEAMACGTPVIGYSKGGCAESVIDGETGILLFDQTTTSLEKAIGRFYATRFDREKIRERAKCFDVSIFEQKMKQAVDAVFSELSQS